MQLDPSRSQQAALRYSSRLVSWLLNNTETTNSLNFQQNSGPALRNQPQEVCIARQIQSVLFSAINGTAARGVYCPEQPTQSGVSNTFRLMITSCSCVAIGPRPAFGWSLHCSCSSLLRLQLREHCLTLRELDGCARVGPTDAASVTGGREAPCEGVGKALVYLERLVQV